MNGISTEELLLQEIRDSREDYRNTTKALASTDKHLALTTAEVARLTTKLKEIPGACVMHGQKIDALEIRVTKHSDAQIQIRETLVELKERGSGLNLKSIEGWRRLLPYIILGGVSLWGLAQQAWNSL